MIRDRYAPSPTGLQHIGGVRTALFNYLFAKSPAGDDASAFILRLEDTDRTRFDPAFVKNTYDTFDWLGFHWDEGPDVGGAAAPYIQSERTALYKQYAEELLAADRAYYCFCSAERLDAVRKEREVAKSSETGYDRHCRDIPREVAAARAAAGEPYVVRLKIPLEDGAATRFHDYLSGDIEWKNKDVNPDPVLLKSDGFPTYHLANVVDDHLMGITHILRAQEWLPSTPLHTLIYEAFGWTPPKFCHLPMVMGQDGKKLSKRHGSVSVDEFRRQGYLPEAVINYIALLGASYEEGRDFYTLSELAERFSLDKLNKAPAVFDYKKLEWYNASYIRMKTDEELAELSLPFALEADLFGEKGKHPSNKQESLYIKAIALVKERAVFLTEIPEKIRYLFAEPDLPDAAEFCPKKTSLEQTIGYMSEGARLAPRLAVLDDEACEALIKAEAERLGVKMGDLLMPLRVAITGSRVSPPLFGSMRLLGAEKSAARAKKALAHIGG